MRGSLNEKTQKKEDKKELIKKPRQKVKSEALFFLRQHHKDGLHNTIQAFKKITP